MDSDIASESGVTKCVNRDEVNGSSGLREDALAPFGRARFLTRRIAMGGRVSVGRGFTEQLTRRVIGFGGVA